MGEYTEMCINVGIKKDIPDEINKLLLALTTGIGWAEWATKDCQPIIPEHPFFKADRWKQCLICNSSYFNGVSYSKYKLNYAKGVNQLSVRSNIKNYDRTYELFLNWISQYLVPDTFFVGYLRRPMSHPRLLYFDGNNIVAYSVELGNDKQIMDGKDNE